MKNRERLEYLLGSIERSIKVPGVSVDLKVGTFISGDVLASVTVTKGDDRFILMRTTLRLVGEHIDIVKDKAIGALYDGLVVALVTGRDFRVEHIKESDVSFHEEVSWDDMLKIIYKK